MASRFEKFSERARRVLSLAQEEAQNFNHNYIGTEHILLGLVREQDCVAAKVLVNLGVQLNKVRSAVEFIIGRGDYHYCHEACFYCVRCKGKSHWNGSRKQSTVWEISHVKSETGHSTQKPIEAMRRPIMNNSKAGDAVYDPFLGSGTTLIACEAEGRVCYGLEIDPVYVDIILARWEKLTGEKAVKL